MITNSEVSSGLTAAVEALRQAGSVLITTHVNPDGDAIGSALGLYHALKAAGKDAVVVNQDGAGQRYRFLPGASLIATSTDRVCDLGVAVDCADIRRVGSARDALERCSRVLRIDHHQTGQSFGDIQYLDPDAAAVGEMVADIAAAMGLPITPDAAICLLASIVEDTGCFQFSRVSPLTLRICGDLVQAGADLHQVVQSIYWRNSEGSARLRGACLQRMETECAGKLAWTVATLEELNRLGAVEEDADEIVHDMLRIGTVELAVLLRESATDYRVSFRSRERVDTGKLAGTFGGGGHERAAGCRVGKEESQIARLLAASRAALEAPDGE